ncbi:prohibitin family protein [Salmonella enterica]|nr:prohibitin family protein [Salmonella enterica]EJD1942467.1 prohibitin family protein [Escherichia coli]EBL0923974.1 prohibitin family protein [Salmonella enterica]ECO7324765.1 prohibitin family protein [Salmonella enterica]ECZ0806948.1 prohibitin family protein [Salmonella enterica]
MGFKQGFSLAVIGIVVLAVLSGIFGSWYTIDQSERGVILRNGRIVGTAEPGLHFKLPFIMGVERVSVQTHKAAFPVVAAYSNDQQPANIRLSVNYSVSPDSVAEVYASSKTVENLVARSLNSSLPEQTENTFGKFTAVSVVRNRADFVQELNKNVRAKLASIKAPLIIESVNVENIDFSRAYEQSVEANMQAEVAIATRRQNLETEKVNADIARTKANGAADAVRAAAQANADAIRMKGDAEAHALQAKGKALADNPNLVDLMAVEKWSGLLPTTQVPGASVPFLNLKTAH